MKLKCKAMCVILASMMTLSMAACSGNSGDDPTTAPSEAVVNEEAETNTQENNQENEVANEPEVDPDMPAEQDMGGYTFVVADIDANRWTPKAGSSDLANAILERNEWVQDTLNINIEFRNHNEDELATAVMAGDKYADIFICNTWEIGRHLNSKRIIDLNTVPTLNLTSEIWTDYNNINLLSYDNKLYGMGAPFASQSDEVWGVYFNKAILEELNLESPYDLMEKDQWNFDTFLEMQRAAQRDLNGDGMLDENDRFGFATGHDWDIAPVMYMASGNSIIKQNGAELSYGVNTPEAFSAIETIKKMLKVGDTFYPKPDGTDMDAYVKAFAEGKVLFLAYSNGNSAINPIFEMEDDYGFVPIPKGPDATDYLCWVSHNAPSLAIPITNTELERTGTIISALAWKAKDEEQVRLDEIAYTRFRDDESVETVKRLNVWGTSDLCFIGQQMVGFIHSGLNVVPNVGFYSPDNEIASEVDSVLENFNIGLEELKQKLQGTYVEPEVVEEPETADEGSEEASEEGESTEE